MSFSNLLYRALRRARLQPFLNWNARLPDVGVTAPLLGVPLGHGLVTYGASWKPEVFRLLASCLQPKSVLDVGANEGQTLVDLAKAAMLNLEVTAFEPNPACAHYLERLIRLNAWRHVRLFPIALSDAVQCRSLEMTAENDAGASLVPGLRPGVRVTERVVVPCFTLDQLVESGALELHRPMLMKVDVEGAELDVLLGSQGVLRLVRPIILCEVLWAHCQERAEFQRSRNAALMALLRDRDYEVFRFLLGRDQRSVLGIEGIPEFPSGTYSASNAHQCDYVFVPRELSQTFRERFASRST